MYSYTITSKYNDKLCELLGKGAYGEVYKDKHGNALKLYYENTNKEKYGFDPSFIREMSNTCIMQKSSYVPVLNEIYFGHDFGYSMERYDMNLKTYITSEMNNIDNIKIILYQIILGLAEAQMCFMLHRDIKPDNILINKNLKISITDWGLSMTKYAKHLSFNTRTVQTIWYRCPEHALGINSLINNDTIDMWSVGVMTLEMLQHKVGFFGVDNEHDLVYNIISLLGLPEDGIMRIKIDNNYSKKYIDPHMLTINKFKEFLIDEPLLFDLLNRMLKWHPDDRISPHEALSHPYFVEYHDISKKAVLNNDIICKLGNLKYYVASSSNILIFNPNYFNKRPKFIVFYEHICKLYKLTKHELVLMISLTDKIMGKCSEISICDTLELISSNEIINIISCSISELIYMLSHEHTIGINNLNDISTTNKVKYDDVKKCIIKIMHLLNFPLPTCTFVTYKCLFSNLHPSVDFLFDDFTDIIIYFDKYIELTPRELFGSIIHKMSTYYYDDITNIIYFSDQLKHLLGMFPKRTDLNELDQIKYVSFLGKQIKKK